MCEYMADGRFPFIIVSHRDDIQTEYFRSTLCCKKKNEDVRCNVVAIEVYFIRTSRDFRDRCKLFGRVSILDTIPTVCTSSHTRIKRSISYRIILVIARIGTRNRVHSTLEYDLLLHPNRSK